MLSDSEFLEIFNKKISELIDDQNALDLYKQFADESRNSGYLDRYDPDFVAVRFAKYFKFISNQKDVSNIDPGYLYSSIVAENDHGFLLYIRDFAE